MKESGFSCSPPVCFFGLEGWYTDDAFDFRWWTVCCKFVDMQWSCAGML